MSYLINYRFEIDLLFYLTLKVAFNSVVLFVIIQFHLSVNTLVDVRVHTQPVSSTAIKHKVELVLSNNKTMSQ